MIKCLHCKKLIRHVFNLSGVGPAVFYHCPKFTYYTGINGLFRPGKILQQAVRECPEQLQECVVCGATKDLSSYGAKAEVLICRKHDEAWGAFLKDHPEKSDYISPHKIVVTRKWFEVFREFIETQRKCRVCGCTWEKACPGGCEWVDWDLCSSCGDILAIGGMRGR